VAVRRIVPLISRGLLSGMRMRQLVVAAVMLVALPLGAQQPTGTLPGPIAADVARLLNGPAARNAVGSLSIAPGDTVQGDVSVLDGTLTVGGRITGRALVVNGDAVLLDGATI